MSFQQISSIPRQKLLLQNRVTEINSWCKKKKVYHNKYVGSTIEIVFMVVCNICCSHAMVCWFSINFWNNQSQKSTDISVKSKKNRLLTKILKCVNFDLYTNLILLLNPNFYYQQNKSNCSLKKTNSVVIIWRMQFFHYAHGLRCRDKTLDK